MIFAGYHLSSLGSHGMTFPLWYHSGMGADLRFDDFVLSVREPLCVLDVEPAFQHKQGESARFIWPPFIAELDAIDESSVRLSLSAHGELIRTVELPLTADAAWLAWNGIAAVFESEAPDESKG
jgi:hypothetical protein